MVQRLISVLIWAHFGLVVTATAENGGGTCGQLKPDPSKTCISIRLPWNPKPFFFCVEKDKFRYRNQCQNRFPSHCGTTQKDSLMVATPWECCPYQSNPDSCSNHQCPSPPYNRKCQSIPPDPNQPWDCCPKHFCEEDTSPDMCHYKLMDQDCNTPPSGKKNCVGFIDEHGCCPKYQCDRDNKKDGFCPAEAQAIKYMRRYNATGNSSRYQAGDPPPPPQAEMAASDDMMVAGNGGARASKMKMASYQSERYFNPIITNNQQWTSCIGDFNCPGNMKCCSNDMHSYVTEGHYLQRNKNSINGYCSEPAPKNATEENSPK